MFGKIKHLNEYKTFKNKLITKKHGIQKKLINYKIFELMYGNTKLTNVWKCTQVSLVLKLFAFTCLYFIVLGKFDVKKHLGMK